jgi:hypothetical protein
MQRPQGQNEAGMCVSSGRTEAEGAAIGDSKGPQVGEFCWILFCVFWENIEIHISTNVNNFKSPCFLILVS